MRWTQHRSSEALALRHHGAANFIKGPGVSLFSRVAIQFLLQLLTSAATVRKQHREHANKRQSWVPTQLYLLKKAGFGPLAAKQERLVFRLNFLLATR